MGNDTSTLIKPGAARRERAERKAGLPKMFHVVLLNDDFTPMEFVAGLLQRIFGYSLAAAEEITQRIHVEGRGVCGTYTRDIAMTKAAQVENLAQGNDHPLRCTVEPDA